MLPVARVAVFFLFALLVFFIALRSFGRARDSYGWPAQAANWYGFGVLFLGILLVAAFVIPGARVLGTLISVLLIAWLLAPPALRKLGWPRLPPLDDHIS